MFASSWPTKEGLALSIRAPTTPQQSIEHVIVLGTISCIGIYFRVDDHRAFAAHVYAYSTDREIEVQQLLQPPSEGEGRFIV